MRTQSLRDHIMPLEELPDERRARIAQLVAADVPPPRWIGFGGSDINYPLAKMESRAWHEWHWARGIDPPRESREPLPRALRAAVIERDGYICQLCRLDVEPTDVHIDHIKPYSKGGRHTLSNLQVTHSTCNLRKGARV